MTRPNVKEKTPGFFEVAPVAEKKKTNRGCEVSLPVFFVLIELAKIYIYIYIYI